MNIILIILFFCLGCLSTFFTLVLLSKRNERKMKREYESIYESILVKLTQNEVTFGSRINNTVQLNTKLEDDVQIMYFLDRQDVSIFQDNNCIYTSQIVKKELIEKILKSIWSKFSQQINDVVQFSNNTFDKRTFTILIGMSSTNDIDEVHDFVELTLDGILDRINEVGYNNLTEIEKQFLKNLNK